MTISKLKEKLKTDFDWQGSESSLRRIVRKLGFKWRLAENNRKLLIEKSDIRFKDIQKINALYSETIKVIEMRFSPIDCIRVKDENSDITFNDVTYGIS